MSLNIISNFAANVAHRNFRARRARTTLHKELRTHESDRAPALTSCPRHGAY